MWAARLQPLVAVIVAPSAYLGFAALTQYGGTDWQKSLLLNGVPVAVAQIAILSDFPMSADVFVLGITSIYLFRVARLLPCNADDFVHVAPHSLRILRTAVYATLFLLGMMVASDLLIVAASVLSGDAFVLIFLTGISGVFTAFIFVVALVGAPMLLRPTKGDLASPETKPMLHSTAEVTETINVSQAPHAVFDYVSDHENDPNWRKGVVSMAHIPSGPAHKGMQTREELVLWGQTRVIMATITRYEVGRLIAFKTIAGELKAHGERKVIATPEGASMSYTVGAKLTCPPAFLIPLIEFGFRLRLRSDLLRLKQLLEANK